MISQCWRCVGASSRVVGACLGLLASISLPVAFAEPVEAPSNAWRLATAPHASESKPVSKESIRIGLDAAMTGHMGQAGIAIERGIRLAISEINKNGGVLGRRLELMVKDHRGIPARGIDNINDFATVRDLVAVVGGLHTPVALAQLEAIHRHGIVYLGPWAAGTPIVENGYQPNYVFRISARDELVGNFLVEKMVRRGFRNPGLLLWRTGWGRSNHRAIMRALPLHGARSAGVEWFNTHQRQVSDELNRLLEAGADAILLVANACEGLTIIQAMAALPADKRVPIISHWGITGADIYYSDPEAFEAVDLTFLQTYSFFAPTAPAKNQKLVDSYCAAFQVCGSVGKIASPVGTAHAYDLIHILRRAIELAGSIDRGEVRSALERVKRHDGLVRTYDPPFTPTRHDALDATDFHLSRYATSGIIVPQNMLATQ